MRQKLLSHLQLTDALFFAPLAIVILTQLLPNNAILGLLSMIVICTIPGYALLYRFKLHRSSRFQDLFFSVLLSLLLIQSVYMAYSVFCYGIGFKNSITKPQVFLIAFVILLFSCLSLRNKKESFLSRQFISDVVQGSQGKNFVLNLIPSSLPLFSLIVVTRLNVLGDSITSLVFIYSLIGILLTLCLNSILRISPILHYLTFYCAALALLLGSAFRGDGGFWSWDINQEFAAASRTLIQQHWIPIADSSYYAMLSISLLPVVMSFLSNFSLTIIFKLFYPLIAALLPVASYSLLRRYVRNSIAIAVVIIQIIGSISYIPQFTALSRQIIGTAFFLGMLLVILDPTWDRKKKTRITILLAYGLSISHYSSAYLCTIIFLLAGFVSFFVRRFGAFRRNNVAPVTTIRLGIAILLITLLWNGVLNNSVQDLKSTAQNITSQSQQFLPNKTGGFIDRWLSGTITAPNIDPANFKEESIESNSYNYPNLQVDAVSLTYEITPTEYPLSKPFLGRSTATLFGWLFVILNFTFQFLIVLQIFLTTLFVLGIISKKRRELFGSAESQILTMLGDLTPLLFVSLVLALYLRITGSVSVFYNPERAALQLAFIFSLSIALLLEGFLKWTKRSQHIWSAALLISCFVFLQSATGLIGYVNGSPSSRISSKISGDRVFVISENERNAANWIDQNTPKNSYLQSDVYANLVNSQKNTFDTRPFIAQTLPFGLFIGSYIYISKANLESGITRQGTGLFRFPFDYLDQNRSVVYSSEGARVYR
jgi:uncharacterized membrane protein